ncbi:hypothetical protein Tsubulata_038948 [Turnera subulata]|uniref:Pectate lyase n=1 Tax=Turnera subulata TaxID=218843 RepID=A0A9Q0JQX0_9ROSI|nr:hypothetical protein Tsubulata_038948 [Turnera subulata]
MAFHPLMMMTLVVVVSCLFPRVYPVGQNPIDACWRGNPNWANNRAELADCAVGFGKDAVGGKQGRVYVVTTPEDDATNPKPGTLRYGAIQIEPLWIIFARDMVIRLESALMVNQFKTIDGRGVKVEIAFGPCLNIKDVSHVIVHGIGIHNCVPEAGRAAGGQGRGGDAIVIFASSNVWIDHCYLASCADGLIDVIHASTGITISNNNFTRHDKVMLLGHRDPNKPDKEMKVTIAFNRFGEGLTQRMPRVRLGYAHVANNVYQKWKTYGSSDPTVFSEGNHFTAPDNASAKQVTKRLKTEKGGLQSWNWRSSRDRFWNGAYFLPAGHGTFLPLYSPSQKFKVAPGASAPALTSDAGPLTCIPGKPC